MNQIVRNMHSTQILKMKSKWVELILSFYLEVLSKPMDNRSGQIEYMKREMHVIKLMKVFLKI